jgi:hypothetical protein
MKLENLEEQFVNSLISAEFTYHLESKEKGDSWKEKSLATLYRKMKRHNIDLGALIANGSREEIIFKATDVLLYAFIISERARSLPLDEI